ncbi:signal recognition particle-docking protein FtsY [Boudabousia tangfeifanii]|uniref:Signal recognition particle receptor FtsY n=1 Tax=Boudabousia tangfeifanii TaxID=1912795 RepID=A0A1D9MJQ2_9ACTO|nr:signal recognition particle-docking protein FtsY [Boudabousia tangfeifanii]AOZ72535.1 signal recognition particle-docking protein FtsY [Boudabousia tangfeifanii]
MQTLLDYLYLPEVWGSLAVVLAAIAGFFGFRNFRSEEDKTDELTSSQSPASSEEAEILAHEPEAGEDETKPLGAPTLDQFEKPEAVASRMTRLRARLARSGALGQALLGMLSKDQLNAADWEEIEETLLSADLGLAATDQIMEALRTELQVNGKADEATIKAVLKRELLQLVEIDQPRELNLDGGQDENGQKLPAAVLVVGVNGVGKTTSVGKIARILVAEGDQVILGAADTFRAAAADQLQTWGERVGVEVVRSDREGADPAAVAFDAVKAGVEHQADVVLVDTAGRLHNKSSLMDELGKIRRVMERGAKVTETLLVLDATTGQNGMAQAKVFAQVTNVTGIVLTKLDGSAKGGIVVSVQRELGVPVKLVGLGEGADDMAPFDPEAFVDAILA